jgi:hypothetical protein
MVVKVRDIVDACDTSTQGHAVFDQIASNLKAGRDTVLDFNGMHGMTSSFVNCAFIPLLDFLPFDRIKQQLSLVGANRQIMNMLRDRMMIHAERRNHAA